MRRVRGILFVDYVRMIRADKSVDLAREFELVDLSLLQQRIDPEGWYPMDSFARFGVWIVRTIAKGNLSLVELWGRLQADMLIDEYPNLIVKDDPQQTLMRFQGLRGRFFDFDAVTIVEALDDSAVIAVQYEMIPAAEEPACHQTLGLFERLIEIAGGTEVKAELAERSWEGADRTVVGVHWQGRDGD